MLFSDTENYTGLADLRPLYDVVHVLNRYFGVMSTVVVTHHGHISNFIGDGLIMIFGLSHPESVVTDARWRRAVAQLNPLPGADGLG